MKRFYNILPRLAVGTAIVFLLAPLVILFVYSFSTNWSDMLPSGFTLQYYQQALSDPRFWPSVVRGLAISLLPIFISCGVILLAFYTMLFRYPGLETVMQTLCMIPHTLKGTILAISVLALYAGKGPVLGNRLILLTFVYCIIILPFVYQGICMSLRTVNLRQLVEAAEMLGAGRMTAFFRIVVPNLLSGILVSALLGMSMIFSDFAVVKIIAGSQYITVQQLLYNARNQAGQYSSVIVLITFFITLMISALAFALQARMEHSRGGKK